MAKRKYAYLADTKNGIDSPYHPDTVTIRPDHTPDGDSARMLMCSVFSHSIIEYCHAAAKEMTFEETEAFMASEIFEWLHGPDFDFFCEIFNLDADRHRNKIIADPVAVLRRLKEMGK